MFAYGTLGESSGVSFLSTSNPINQLSRVAELYSNGISTEAHSYDIYDTVMSRVGIETYFSELIKSNAMFTLPGLWVVYRWIEAVPSFQSLFNATLGGQAYILPNSGLAMYSSSIFLAIPVDILYHIFIVKLIYYFHKKKSKSSNVAYHYLFAYCEMICGCTLINNLMIAFSLLSALPFLLFLLLKTNEFGNRIKLK